MSKKTKTKPTELPDALLAWMAEVETLLCGCMAADPDSKRRFEELQQIGKELRTLAAE